MEDYTDLSAIDFLILANHWRDLALWKNDLFLGMQGMNIGIIDVVITHWEYRLRSEYIDEERTPVDVFTTVSALSQMWLFALYEVMRVWRDRIHNYRKWYQAGGLTQIITNLDTDDDLHLAIHVKRRQAEWYRDDAEYRKRAEREWGVFEPVYRRVELLRMNLAKHAAPGKDTMLARTPGYGRINLACGAIDFEVIEKDGNYSFLNRRDIADALRNAFTAIKA